MARITDEDCIIQVPNRFELVVLAAQRAKQIAARSPITVERDNDKNTVVALREIAGPTINLENLRTSLVDLHRQYVQTESHEEDLDEFLLSSRDSDHDQISDDNHDQQQSLIDDTSENDLVDNSETDEDSNEIDMDDHEDLTSDQDSESDK